MHNQLLDQDSSTPASNSLRTVSQSTGSRTRQSSIGPGMGQLSHGQRKFCHSSDICGGHHVISCHASRFKKKKVLGGCEV